MQQTNWNKLKQLIEHLWLHTDTLNVDCWEWKKRNRTSCDMWTTTKRWTRSGQQCAEWLQTRQRPQAERRSKDTGCLMGMTTETALQGIWKSHEKCTECEHNSEENKRQVDSTHEVKRNRICPQQEEKEETQDDALHYSLGKRTLLHENNSWRELKWTNK